MIAVGGLFAVAREVQRGVGAEQVARRVVVRAGGFDARCVHAEMSQPVVVSDCCAPLAALLIPVNTLEPAGRSGATVPRVLRAGRRSQVRAAVVEGIPVDMIDLFSGPQRAAQL